MQPPPCSFIILAAGRIARFVERMPYTAFPMVFFAYSRSGKCTGTSFVDSTTIDVCDNHRIQQHKVFKNIAQRGKSHCSMAV